MKFLLLSEVFPLSFRPLCLVARLQFEAALSAFMVEVGDTGCFCWIPGMAYAE